MTKNVSVVVRVTPEWRKMFKVACANRGITMRSVLMHAMKHIIDGTDKNRK